MKKAVSISVLVLFLCTLAIFAGGGKIMAQETNQDDIQKKIDELKKQKELLEAQKALLEAQKALDKAKEPLTLTEKETQDKIAAAKAAKDLADAQKALSDSRLAEFKSSLGEVPQAPYTGSVDLKDKGSELPAALLAAKAVKAAASKIAGDLNKVLAGDAIGGSGKRTLIVFASSEVPTFQNLAAYRAQLLPVQRALKAAIDESNKYKPEAVGPHLEVVPPPLGAAGFTLDAINKLVGFFRTDYTVGGAEVAFDDSVLVLEAANRFCESCDVKLPALYDPKAILQSETTIIDDLTTLSAQKIDAAGRAATHERYVESLNAMAAQEKDPAKKEEIAKKNQPIIAIHKEIADHLKQAISIYDQFFARMTTLNEKANQIPIVAVAKEAAVFDALTTPEGKPAYLLVLHIHKSGGGYLIKKNFWTFFGSMPLYYLGGTVVTYALLNGPDGCVRKSGVVPIYGGWVKASGMQKALED